MKGILKKSLSIVLTFMLIVSAVCSTALISAAAGDFIIENGMLTKYIGTAADVIIPDEVTSIGYGAFQNCTGLTSVTIPNSVTDIDIGAFENCTTLTSVTISAGVLSIGDEAFMNCTSLSNITVDQNNKNYSSENGVLFDKQKTELIQYPIGNPMTNYAIPGNVLSIDDSAFKSAAHLTCVTIPDSVLRIDTNAFEQCTGLTSIAIPNSVIQIRSQAFKHCTNLTSVTISSSSTSIDDDCFTDTAIYNNPSNWVNNNVLYIDHCLIKAKAELSGSCAIEPDTRCIAREAFSGTGLTSATIPSSVVSIGDNAFANTPLYDNSSNWVNSFINKVLYIDHCLIKTKMLTGSYVINTGTRCIAEAAFFDCTSFSGITIPSSVTSIGIGAFSSCTNLANITVDQNNLIYSSKDGVLFNKDQTALVCYPQNHTGTNYIIPDSVTSIENYAFANVTHLANLTIPYSVTEIKGTAFSGISSDFALYCTASSVAQSYAVANSINYTVVNITPADKAVIDYTYHRVYSDHRLNKSLQDVISYTASGLTVQSTASLTGSGNSYYGTDSVIKLYSGNTFIATYTVIVYGDLNGDSVCDAMDAMAAALIASGHCYANQNQIAAANAEASGTIDDSAYQYIVNKALSA